MMHLRWNTSNFTWRPCQWKLHLPNIPQDRRLVGDGQMMIDGYLCLSERKSSELLMASVFCEVCSRVARLQWYMCWKYICCSWNFPRVLVPIYYPLVFHWHPGRNPFVDPKCANSIGWGDPTLGSVDTSYASIFVYRVATRCTVWLCSNARWLQVEDFPRNWYPQTICLWIKHYTSAIFWCSRIRPYT